MQVLSWLAAHGTEDFLAWLVVCLVHVILKHREEMMKIQVRREEIGLQREQSGLAPGRQPTQSVRARHARWWRLVRRLVRR